jgi:hypothetical protein
VGPILFFIFGAKQQSVNCVGPFFVDFVVLTVRESVSELCSGFSTFSEDYDSTYITIQAIRHV